MADYKMKAREYKKGMMYWFSLHKDKNEKGQRLIRPALYIDNRLIDGVWHYAWMFFGVNSYLTFKEDEFDTDGQIETYRGKKWETGPKLNIKRASQDLPQEGTTETGSKDDKKAE